MILHEDKFKIKAIAKDTLNNKKLNISFVPPMDDDALSIAASFSNNYSNSHFNYSNETKNNDYTRAILDCRFISLHPLIKKILDYIEIEAFPVSSDVTGRTSKISVKIDTDELNDYVSSKIIEEIRSSYFKCQRLLKFKTNGSKLFRNWYIDGRQAFHVIWDKSGIVELRDIDVTKLRKVREEVREKIDGVEVITDYKIKYIYTPKSTNYSTNQYDFQSNTANNELEIDESCVIYITSGLLDESRKRTVSHLEPLIKPIHNLDMIENSHIITRVANAAQTRVVYVDIGPHASNRTEQIVSQIQAKMRHNMEFDTKTGRLRDNRRFLSVLNDIFIPRLTGSGSTTEIKTLPSDENIDKINGLEYFKNDVLEKSPVPKQRITSNQSFSMGKSNELSREESIFHKQVESLRQKYADLFHEFIKKDLIIRNVMSGEDYDVISDDIYFIFPTDNHYKMMLEFEILDEKMSRIQAAGHDPAIFFGIERTAKDICGFNEKETADAIKKWQQDSLLKSEIDMQKQELEFKRMKEIDPEQFNQE